MNRPRRPDLVRRRAILALALLALFLKVLVPPGFMVAAPTNELPFPVVLCTMAERPVVVAPGEAFPTGHPVEHQPDQGRKQAPCPFALQPVETPPPTAIATTLVWTVALDGRAVPTARTLQPGRGLSAPPPPSRGPPTSFA